MGDVDMFVRIVFIIAIILAFHPTVAIAICMM
jgi:hypothetical protein